MRSKWPSVFVMGAMSLVLMSVLDVLVAQEAVVGLPSLWVSWAVDLALTGFVAWKATSSRMSWGFLSLINAVISFAIVSVNAVLPAASAPYEPGNDWLRSIDLTPPIAARLREAMAAGYFAIVVIIAGLIFVAAAYSLLHSGDDSSRHAH